MADESIAIKGIKEGLLLTLKAEGGDWATMTSRLVTRLNEQPAFFKGARVALDVGERPVIQHDLDNLRAIPERREMTLWAVISSSGTTQNAARNLGLETGLIAQNEQLDTPEINPEEAGMPGVFIGHTLRSGRTVRTTGHVVVYGDVNPGAVIIAGGSVIIWGRLRGMVHAGANGDENAIVCALDLMPTQLRIASYISVSPPDKRRKPLPEIASVRQGRIVAEAWNG
jgi:septum site-determining protein MinC